MNSFDLTALKPVPVVVDKNAKTTAAVVVPTVASPYLYQDAFKAWMDRVPDPVTAVILPAASIPKGLTPFDTGIDYRAAFRCHSSYEGKLTAAIVQDGKEMGSIGDWILVFGSPY